MDEIDHQILAALQKDGRTPFTKIAKQTGVSESTIRARYAAMVDAKIVNTVSIVDPFALGFHAPAIISIRIEPGKIDEVGNTIRKFPEVAYEIMVLGSCDLIIEIYCRDMPHLTDFVTNRLQKVDGIISTETLMIAKLFKLSYLWSPDPEAADSD